ncbi:MAG: sugar transferase [Bacteroidota bacterium]
MMDSLMYYGRMKTLLDPFIAALIFMVTLPLMVLIALLVAASIRQNPFFSRRRALALGGREFTLFKFRTMSEADTRTLLSVNVADVAKVFLKPSSSNAVPPVCRFLRRTGLDELPQLLNIMKGEMSIIGPRPLDLYDLRILAEADPQMNERRKNLPVLPGITGLWQIYGKRSQGLKNLISLDEEYVLSLSFGLDLRILLETFRRMVLANFEEPV